MDASGVLAADVGLLGRLFQHLFECALVLGGTDVHGWTLTADADGTVRYEVSGVEWRT